MDRVQVHKTKKRDSLGRLILLAVFFLLSGCENIMQDMYNQPKYEPFEKSKLFPDEQSARPLVDNTVIHSSGGFSSPSSGREGVTRTYRKVGESELAQGDIPVPITLKLLRRGQERYNIYCTPCHGPAGYGDGLAVRHGFPAPPSYHLAYLRSMPDAHFYNVITRGFGRMFSYADRVKPRDRWAIVAYIRALQLSQHAQLAEVLAILEEKRLQSKKVK